MDFGRDMDHELSFDDDRAGHEPVRIRNAVLVDGHVHVKARDALTMDPVTAYAAHERKSKQVFGPEFGASGGQAAMKYSSGVFSIMHHQQDYSPVVDVTEEYLKDHEH